MKTTITLLFLAITNLIFAQVSIPNITFEYYLINLNIDSDGVVNGQMSTTDALAVTTLDITNLNLTDITGVSGMQNLTTLYASGNNLNSVNLNLPVLNLLTLDNNNLTTLDLSGTPALTIITARNNTSLSTIVPDQNLIYTEIRLSNCALTGNLNLSDLTNLEVGEFSNNALSGIDVTDLTNLSFLAVDNCGLTDLDVTTNPNLMNLTALNNSLACLDLSQNSILTGLEVNGNDPNLTIVVADVTAANSGTGNYQNWYKDATATYNTSCGTASTEGIVLENDFTIYPNPFQDILTINSNSTTNYAIFNINGSIVNSGTIQNGNNTINVAKFNKGIYFIKIKTDTNTVTKKIIKQ